MIRPGDRVTVHYALSVESGATVESTFESATETFRFGRGEFPEGLERRLVDLAVGDDIEFTIAAEEGVFGRHDPNNRHTLDRASFDDAHCRVGALIEFELPNGERVSGRVESIDEDKVIVDFNHPLAGRTVHCRLALVGVNLTGNE